MLCPYKRGFAVEIIDIGQTYHLGSIVMNKKYKSMIGIIAIVVIIACAYSWFHVSGREIDGVSGISEGCSVTVRIGRDDYQEYVLNAEQIVSLKTLILNCSFTRDLSSVVY